MGTTHPVVVAARIGCTMCPVHWLIVLRFAFENGANCLIWITCDTWKLILLSFVHWVTCILKWAQVPRRHDECERENFKSTLNVSNSIDRSNDVMASLMLSDATNRVSIFVHYYLLSGKRWKTPRPHLIVVWNENFLSKWLARLKSLRNEERNRKYNRHEFAR